MVLTCLLGRTSTKMNLMFRNIVMRNGILLMNMMLIHSVTSGWCCSTSGGIGSMLSSTCWGMCCTVFPLRVPRLGPKMFSAALISDLVTGQFLRCLIAMSDSCLLPGCMMMFCNFWAQIALWYICAGNLVLFLSTVL